MNTSLDSSSDHPQPIPSDIRAGLLSLGWRKDKDQFRSYADMFWKRHETATKSHPNSDRDGANIIIYVSEFNGVQNAEMELVGELPDGTWVKLLNYGLPKTTPEILATIPRMLATWECMANHGVENSLVSDISS